MEAHPMLFDMTDPESDLDYVNLTEEELRDVLHSGEYTAPAADDMPIDDVIDQVESAYPTVEITVR